MQVEHLFCFLYKYSHLCFLIVLANKVTSSTTRTNKNKTTLFLIFFCGNHWSVYLWLCPKECFILEYFSFKDKRIKNWKSNSLPQHFFFFFALCEIINRLTFIDTNPLQVSLSLNKIFKISLRLKGLLKFIRLLKYSEGYLPKVKEHKLDSLE